MKKIVGILGMAAMLGSAAFAAEPAANFVMADFTGNAEFGWKADFSGDDATMGMFNGTSASVKFGFTDAGDKTTTGDGVWGELKITSGATSITNGQIKLGKPKADDNKNKKDDYGLLPDSADSTLLTTDKDGVLWLNLPNFMPVAGVSVAKIHFVNDDFNLALNILPPSLAYDAFTAFTATPVGMATKGIGNVSGGNKVDYGTLKYHDDDNLSAGFGLEIGLKDVFAANFKLKDNGKDAKASEKKFGLGFDVSLLALEGLDAKVAGSFNFDNGYSGFQALAAYKLAIDDTLYVKPGVAFDINHRKQNDDTFKDTKALAAGVMFGWGASGLKPELDYISTASDKFAEGVSVAVSTGFEDKDLQLGVSLYDQSLFNMLGLEDFGTLKTGVEFTMNQAAKKNELKLAAKYNVTFSPVYFAFHGGMDLRMYEEEKPVDFKDASKKSKNVVDYTIGLTIGSKEIIDNTDVYVTYNFGNAIAEADDKKPGNITKTNNLTIGSKISF